MKSPVQGTISHKGRFSCALTLRSAFLATDKFPVTSVCLDLIIHHLHDHRCRLNYHNTGAISLVTCKLCRNHNTRLIFTLTALTSAHLQLTSSNFHHHLPQHRSRQLPQLQQCNIFDLYLIHTEHLRRRYQDLPRWFSGLQTWMLWYVLLCDRKAFSRVRLGLQSSLFSLLLTKIQLYIFFAKQSL